MLHEFLLKYRAEILKMTEAKSLELAGVRASSEQLRGGLPIFYQQLIGILRVEGKAAPSPSADINAMAVAASATDETALAEAGGRPDEAEVAKAAGLHGIELLRLGYTLSHVVHAYGAMCQSITELATKRDFAITAGEFHDLNHCLDIAIAGAVTEYQSLRNTQDITREVEHLGFLAHELRNALGSANIALQLIQRGTVGFGGSTGLVLTRSMKRIEDLIDRSLTEVRLRVDPKIHPEPVHLLQLVDQIVLTAAVEAQQKGQVLEIHVDPTVEFEADQQLIYSALSNLIQNALKYSRAGGKIQVRGSPVGDQVAIEVEDECGGLPSDAPEDLFKPFEQQHGDRRGLGLGLTIAQRAVALIHGTIGVQNLAGKGCIFKITLPLIAGQRPSRAKPAA